MNTTIEERKEKAIEIMKKLDIFKDYINGFKQNNMCACLNNLEDIGLINTLNLLKEKRD